MTTSSPFHLGIIFEKDANGQYYTARARLYQDILSYAFADNNTSSHNKDLFSFNDLAKFVLQKNQEYRKYYSGFRARVPISARIANRRDSIQNCLDNLVQIRLIVKRGYAPALRNGIPTPKYAFTESGETVALLLERLDASKKQSTEKKILQLLKLQYSRSDTAKNTFHLKFLERLERDGLLSEILDSVTDYLSHPHELEQILNVYGFVTFRAFRDPEIRMKVWQSYLAAFDDVDDKTRRIVIRQEKQSLEYAISLGSRLHTREWEELWIENAANDSKITLAGFCIKCNSKSAIVVDYFDYKKGILNTKDGAYVTVCPKCQAENSLYVFSDPGSKDIQRLLTLRFL